MADTPGIMAALTSRRSELFSDHNEWEQFMVYMVAFEVFLRREAKYHSLWQQYGAKDSLHHMRSKLSRCERAMETMLFNPAGTKIELELSVGALDEEDAIDLINYAAFFLRNVRAGRIENTTAPKAGTLGTASEDIKAGDQVEIDFSTGRIRRSRG